MVEATKELIKRLLRVPPEPVAPQGAPGSVRVFRAAPGFFRYRLLGWGLGQAGALAGIGISLAFLAAFEDWSVGGLFLALEGLAIAFFVLQLAASFVMLALDYEYRWYMVTDRSLRIREGVLKVQEKTMTFSNVQNVSIRQGPFQRLFGISDLEVRTAGGGQTAGGNQQQGQSDNLHTGYFRGVANAAEIRDAILAHLRRLRSAGLGDPDEAGVERAGGESADEAVVTDDGALLAASREVLAEARALRQLFA